MPVLKILLQAVKRVDSEKKGDGNQIIITGISIFFGIIILLFAFLQYVLTNPIEVLKTFFEKDEIVVVEHFQKEELEKNTVSYPLFLPGGTDFRGDASLADKLINEAYKHIGKAYVWAAFGPDTFDCSGYVAYCLRKSGVQNVPARPTCRTLWANDIIEIRPEEKRPGDLIFFAGTQPLVGASHIGIYLGGGKFIEANSDLGVTISDTNSNWSIRHFYGYGRPKALAGAVHQKKDSGVTETKNNEKSKTKSKTKSKVKNKEKSKEKKRLNQNAKGKKNKTERK